MSSDLDLILTIQRITVRAGDAFLHPSPICTNTCRSQLPKAKTVQDFETLLPWNVQVALEARARQAAARHRDGVEACALPQSNQSSLFEVRCSRLAHHNVSSFARIDQ